MSKYFNFMIRENKMIIQIKIFLKYKDEDVYKNMLSMC